MAFYLFLHLPIFPSIAHVYSCVSLDSSCPPILSCLFPVCFLWQCRRSAAPLRLLLACGDGQSRGHRDVVGEAGQLCHEAELLYVLCKEEEIWGRIGEIARGFSQWVRSSIRAPFRLHTFEIIRVMDCCYAIEIHPFNAYIFYLDCLHIACNILSNKHELE